MPVIDDAVVTDVLERFAAAYSARDAAGVLSLMSAEPDIVMVGTGGDEVRIGAEEVREQIERDISQADEISFSLGPIRVHTRGEVGWAFAEPDVTVTVAGHTLRMPMRMTAVVLLEDGRPVVHSGHLSVALSAQAAGESFADV